MRVQVPSSVEQLSAVDAVSKGVLSCGDCVVVTTKNSIYSIWPLEDDTYAVVGGWFDKQSQSPSKLRINGCTWGGTAIKHDIVAAPGLFLEFGNGVKTTRIQRVCVIRADREGLIN